MGHCGTNSIQVADEGLLPELGTDPDHDRLESHDAVEVVVLVKQLAEFGRDPMLDESVGPGAVGGVEVPNRMLVLGGFLRFPITEGGALVVHVGGTYLSKSMRFIMLQSVSLPEPEPPARSGVVIIKLKPILPKVYKADLTLQSQ
ncbi:hypothetical protein PG993_004279 [Apiospora rasikravindrae]|uniref:Uncharacterized protein n=1 Tax=Apiospora rasikravindrae TaxID=990691 RepID=A0ABR1TE94_9PEZI